MTRRIKVRRSKSCPAPTETGYVAAPVAAAPEVPRVKTTSLQAAAAIGDVECIDYSELRLKEEIGSGHFKKVLRGRFRQRDVVVLRLDRTGESKEMPRELRILLEASAGASSKPFVPELYSICEDGEAFVLAQELAHGGTLKQQLDAGTKGRPEPAAPPTPCISASSVPIQLNVDDSLPFSNSMKLLCCQQIAAAMAFLETRRVVHGDLSCRNVLVFDCDRKTSKLTCKVTDFGLAFLLDKNQEFEIRRQHKALRWCSPEVVKNKRYSHASDVWALAATIWELYADGVHPWACISKKAVVKDLLKAMADHFESSETGETEKHISDFQRLLVEASGFSTGEPTLQDAFSRQAGGCPEDVHALLLSCLVQHSERPSLSALSAALSQRRESDTPKPTYKWVAAKTIPEGDDEGGLLSEIEVEKEKRRRRCVLM